MWRIILVVYVVFSIWATRIQSDLIGVGGGSAYRGLVAATYRSRRNVERSWYWRYAEACVRWIGGTGLGMIVTGLVEAGASGLNSVASFVIKSVNSLIVECVLVIQNILAAARYGLARIKSF